jgi:hypothetical protein
MTGLSSFKSKIPMAFEMSALSRQTNDIGPGAYVLIQNLKQQPQCFHTGLLDRRLTDAIGHRSCSASGQQQNVGVGTGPRAYLL